jgi:demethylmenaquinone methyltransferase/2-methoxy-6-polyprenyl-1,4-benzoquinol methylase
MGEANVAMTRSVGPTPGAPERDAVRAMFDRIAPRYDLLNRVLSAGVDVRWRRAAVDALGLRGPSRVLDLCTGTADLLGEALGRDPGSTGWGVDLSLEMLRRGRGKLALMGMSPRSGLAAADAEWLPLASGTFEGAVVGFGIRNVGDRERALRELVRVLRPGGRLVILEFSMPPGPLGMLYRFYFEQVLPRIGALVSGDASAYQYLPASVERFPTPAAFGALMERAGFVGVRFRPLTWGIAHLYQGDRPCP